MLKETGYKEKFEMLKPWLPFIVDGVRSDLKKEHFRQDPSFCRRYFLGKNPKLIGAVELAEAYSKEVAEGNVGLAEFIATRWLWRHKNIYEFFEKRILEIYPDFESVEEFSEPFSEQLVGEARLHFGSKLCYLFSVLNSVVFPRAVYDKLRLQAIREDEQHLRM